MKNYIITTRTESVWGELWNDTFKVRAKNSGVAVAKKGSGDNLRTVRRQSWRDKRDHDYQPECYCVIIP